MNGASGVNGANCATGSISANGANGANGATGANDVSGVNGANGATGASGDWGRLFSDYLQRVSGIFMPPEKDYLFETRLSKMAIDAGSETFEDFYYRHVVNGGAAMEQKIINAMTTNETLWFRDKTPWLVITESILPRLVSEIRSGKRRRARVWHAASSTGQEAYSTVMCVDDFLSKNRIRDVSLSNFEFLATDISTRVLEIAARGRYDSISIRRGLDDYHREKYFVNDGSAWHIAPKIRDAVRFERFNLMDRCDTYGLFDIIFLRYILIYFDDALKKETVGRMNAALREDGTLFTGNYALLGVFDGAFDARHRGNMTYYTKTKKEIRPGI